MNARRLGGLAAIATLFFAMRLRAMECDCVAARYCAEKADIADELDRRLRGHIAEGRSAEAIYTLEGGDSILRPRIERWANDHPEAARPDRTRFKYRGAKLPVLPGFSWLDASVKIGGVCVGADKLGHFFQQGWECYVIAERDGRGAAVAHAYAEWLEGAGKPGRYAAEDAYFRSQPSGKFGGYGGFGRNISGVISHADVAASDAGVRFYRDLAAGKFKTIRDYVSRDWCEEHNHNEYTPEMKRIVEGNAGGR